MPPQDDLIYEPLADGTAVILDVKTRKFFTLNETARAVYEWVRAGKPLDEIVPMLAGEYDVDAETCRVDVARVARELAEMGLVEATLGSQVDPAAD